MMFFWIAVLIGLLPATIAHAKGRNFLAWWFYGAGLFIVALPHAIVMGQRDGNGRMKCPHCAEMILAEAQVCRFCARDVAYAPHSPLTQVVESEPRKSQTASAQAMPIEAITVEPQRAYRPLESVQKEINDQGKLRFFLVAGVAATGLVVWLAFFPGLKPADMPPTKTVMPQTIRRTVYMAQDAYLRTAPSVSSGLAGKLKPGVAFDSDRAVSGWVHVTIGKDSLSGWIRETDLWTAPRPQAVTSSESGNQTSSLAATSPTVTPSPVDPSLMQSARRVVNKMVAMDAIRSIDGPYSIVVGPRFYELGFAVQQAVCDGVSLMRIKQHQTDGFYLKDPLTNEKIGEFSNARLVMN